MNTSSRVLGSEHTRTLRSIESLAIIYNAHGLWSKTEDLQKQLLQISTKKTLGDTNRQMLRKSYFLAKVLRNQRKWAEAKEVLVEVTEKMSIFLGSDDEDTLRSTALLALSYQDQGQWTKSEELLTSTIPKLTEVVGPEHPDTLQSLDYLRSFMKNKKFGEKQNHCEDKFWKRV